MRVLGRVGGHTWELVGPTVADPIGEDSDMRNHMQIYTQKFLFKIHRGRGQSFPIFNISCRYLVELGPRQLGLPIADTKVADSSPFSITTGCLTVATCLTEHGSAHWRPSLASKLTVTRSCRQEHLFHMQASTGERYAASSAASCCNHRTAHSNCSVWPHSLPSGPSLLTNVFFLKKSHGARNAHLEPMHDTILFIIIRTNFPKLIPRAFPLSLLLLVA